ncbi:AfsR/SARP family transcriptional regulator [Spirilliplanes yamanashiensis]|uniref:OmpR/PhoB-type domain-containing protein n=1 Tax=Spirilliplanes yamanashiensis TaxID=42233 RepID=A0A8J4DKH1_9ACTN|nr:BTAD domain-containing putative transcriptional regulator [Spirilliplanes yamanashiensis]MDP9818838.1 DNA-binding SARP family transcriptional activator/energy-coupling factor transporter ATP-binding protein EcfA2 [Spirilliplanes yamanashiensis]GIJ05292.1 hypothetical protein Sya03_46440 [Spirilliplanes yamanashiensis]
MRVTVLGNLAVVDADGRAVPADRLPRRARQVLGVLAARHDRVQGKDALADAVWGGEGLPGNHAAALEHYVSLLRRTLQPGVPPARTFIVTRGGGYLFDTGRAALDLAELRDLVRRADAGEPAAHDGVLELAADLPFAEDQYADWADAVRQEVRAAVLAAWLHVAEQALPADPARASRLALRAVDADPYSERAYRAAIAAAAALGRPDDALRLYERCRRILTDELGVPPSPELLRLRGDLLRPAAPRPTAFLGREVETTLLLGDAAPPVAHIVGPAGAGKSALLRHLAAVAPDRVRPVDAAAGAAGTAGSAGPGGAADATGTGAETAPDGTGAETAPDGGAAGGALDSLPAAVVLTVDDADRLDDAGVAALAAVLRRDPAARLVLAYRYPSVAAAGPLAVLGSPLVVRLAPLSAAELGDAALAEATGGIPALVAAAGLPAATAATVAPHIAVQVARDRTRWMPPAAWEVLRACAALGPLRVPDLAAVVDAPVAELVRSVDQLVHAHLLREDDGDRVAHRSTMVRDAVGAQVSVVARRHLAGRLQPPARYASPAAVGVSASRYRPNAAESPTAGSPNQA